MDTCSILIVEPDEAVRTFARNVLSRAGYLVVTAARVDEVTTWRRRESAKPPAAERSEAVRTLDAVLLDAAQATPEGFALLVAARIRDLPVIITVPRGHERAADDLLHANGSVSRVEVAGIIEKPFDPEWLLAAVEDALRPRPERTIPQLYERFFASGAIDIPLVDGEDTTEDDGDGFRPATPSPAERLPPLTPLELVSRSVELVAEGELPAAVRAAMARQESRAQRLAERVATIFTQRHPLGRDARAALVEACQQALEEADAGWPLARADSVRPTRAKPPASAFADDAEDVVLSGTIGRAPMDQVLQFTGALGKKACCVVENAGAKIRIYLDGTDVLFAKQENLHDGFTIGRFLIDDGAVSEEEVEITAVSLPEIGPLGKRLIALGHLDPAELSHALRRQTEELVFEALRWSRGRFWVTLNPSFPREATDAGIRISVQHLLLEGLRRLDEWRRIEREVGDFGAVVERIEVSNRRVVDSLPPEQRALLEHVDGRRTVQELVCAMKRPTFDVCRALYDLHDQRLVTVIDSAASA